MSPVPPWVFVMAGVGWVAIVAVVYVLIWIDVRDRRRRERCYGSHQG